MTFQTHLRAMILIRPMPAIIDYIETCEVLLDYPKIGGNDVIEYNAKKAIGNLLHANIDVYSRRLIAEFPKYGIKCIEKL